MMRKLPDPNKPLHRLAPLAALAAAGLLSGCISIGAKPPPSVMTLTAIESIPAGTSFSGSEAIVVREPEAPAELSVTRVPVQVNPSKIAYLKDAQWVDRPTRLFASLVSETISARQKLVVLPRADRDFTTRARIGGRLSKFGYDVPSGSVVVRFDGVIEDKDGNTLTRRFEQRIPDVPAEAAPVADALNVAANAVAVEVSDWAAAQN